MAKQRKNFEDAIIKITKENELEIDTEFAKPKPKRRNVTRENNRQVVVYMPPELHDKVKAAAKSRDMSVSKFILAMIKRKKL